MADDEDEEEREQLRRLAEMRAHALANPNLEMRAQFEAMLAAQRDRDSKPVTVDEIAALPDEVLSDRLAGRLFTVVSADRSDLMSRPPLIRSWYTTKHFENEVMNGGLHQFFMNTDDEWYWMLVVDGYRSLGLPEVAELIETRILPVARDERPLRASLTNIVKVSKSYAQSCLPALDDLIGEHDERRQQVARENPQLFAI
jgi:hypothetical protein